jgi:acetylglutamate kinase
MAKIKQALIKVSGDVVAKEELYQLLSSLEGKYKLFILCGGGTTITEKLNEEKIPFRFEAGRRVIKSEKGKTLAHQVLEEKRIFVEGRLQERGIKAAVYVPVIKLGEKLCHINGDDFVRMAYQDFDKVFVVTLKGKDKSSLRDIQNVEIIRL